MPFLSVVEPMPRTEAADTRLGAKPPSDLVSPATAIGENVSVNAHRHHARIDLAGAMTATHMRMGRLLNMELHPPEKACLPRR